MKIVHCTEWYYPKQDGVSNVVRRYAEYFARQGHESWVITSLWDNSKEYEEISGVKVARLPVYGNDVKGMRGDREFFLDILRRERFDVVVTYAAQTWHFDILKKVSKAEICSPVIIGFPCGFSGLLGFRKFFYANYFRVLPRYLSNFDLLALHSKNYIDYLFVKSNYSGELAVIPNGVDTREFSEIDSGEEKRIRELLVQNGVDIEKKLVLNVGNHMHAKNHKDFIKLSKFFKNCEFVQVGADSGGLWSCGKKCRRADSRIPNYHSLKLERKDLRALYKTADIFVLTSTTEMFPLVILESMASKTPFISYDVGAVSGLKGGVTVRDFNSLKAALSTLLEDGEKYVVLKESGYLEAIGNYKWEEILERYKSIVDELISRSKEGNNNA